MTTREQVEAEAAELYPTPYDPYAPHEVFQERAAHIRAKTTSAEQVEAVAMSLRNQLTLPLDEIGVHVVTMSPHQVDYWVGLAQVALEAAGLIVEGDDE